MTRLDDAALDRLRQGLREPDLGGTPYELRGTLGRGGMGTVYLARDTRLERDVALKVVELPEARPDLAPRLLREARLLARLEHPGIVPVHDVGTLADGRLFYAMKRVEGARLDQHIAGDGGEPGGLAQRLRLFQRICAPVAFAHARGVLHRDLKPENVMIGPFGEVLVLDWGVAKLLAGEAAPGPDGETAPAAGGDAVATTAHGTVLGTPGYMAPEQAAGQVDGLDARTDVHALGALLRFLLTGQAPGEALPERALPPPLAAIVARAMAPARDGRYASVEELEREVGRFLDGLRVEAHREGLAARAWRLLRRHRVAVVLIAAYLAMRLLLLAALGR